MTPTGGGGGGTTGGFTGGGGGTTTTPPATGGGGGAVPFTGGPFIELVATAIVITVAGCVLMALVPRRDRFARMV